MSIRQLFVFILFAGIFAFSVRAPQDPDMWWHLKTGQYILEEGIPHQDPPWSFTATDHKWIAHEWLTDVFMYGLYQTSGLVGLSLVFAAVVTAAFGLLYLASDGRPYIAGLAALWGVAASLPLLNVRPQMFNILFGAAVVYVVERVRRGEWSGRWLLILAPLTVLWVNMHGGYLLGLAIMGVYLVGESAQHWFHNEHHEGLSWEEIRLLFVALIASFFGALLNPYTYEMWTYAISTTLTSDAMRSAILEWRPPDFHVWYFWFFGFMVMATWLVMVFSKRPVTWTDILFVVGTSFAAYQSVRNIPLFALVAVPILARHAVGMLRPTVWYGAIGGERPEGYIPPRLRQLNLVLAALVVFGVALFTVDELSDTQQVVEDLFPVAAVDYLEANGLDQARIFNEYGWGGYLIWRGVPTFIDGRADLFGDEFIFFYMQTNTRDHGWREPLEQYDVEYILTRTDGGLAVLLDVDGGWEIIYEDDLARIYGRAGG